MVEIGFLGNSTMSPKTRELRRNETFEINLEYVATIEYGFCKVRVHYESVTDRQTDRKTDRPTNGHSLL